ncbi:MAG TPA: hypothetical protein VNP73_05270, partial [Actinomycetota bacterium]|nr:hypothetical protein [Actinomycetota bacterium]
ILSKAELEIAKRGGTKLSIFVIGVLRIQKSVTPALADETIEHIQIFGSIKGPQAVIDRLGERVMRGFGKE